MPVYKTDINPKTGKAYAINPNSGVWDDNYWASQVDPVVNAEYKAQEKATADREAFTAGQRAREQDFLGRFQTAVPQAITAIETELGLPQLRQNALTAGQAARGVADQVRSIAPTQQTIAKQVGISAPRLQQRIGAKTAEMAPAIDAAMRNSQEANASAQFGETEFGRRLDQKLLPFKTEASMLSESLAREFTGFTNQMQGELTTIIEKMRQGHELTMGELNKANQLAQQEREFENQKKLLTFQSDQSISNEQRMKELGLGSYKNSGGLTTFGNDPLGLM